MHDAPPNTAPGSTDDGDQALLPSRSRRANATNVRTLKLMLFAAIELHAFAAAGVLRRDLW
jgi:hypothetical protein